LIFLTKKEFCEFFGGDQTVLKNVLKNVNKNDEKAIEDWIAYEVAKHKHNKQVDELYVTVSDEMKEANWALDVSEELLGLIHSDDKMKADKEKLEADLKIEDDKFEEVQKKIKEAYKTWYEGEFKGKKDEFSPLELGS
jgi:hypothetical protein